MNPQQAFFYLFNVMGRIVIAIIFGPAALLVLVLAFVLALAACFTGVAALIGLIGEVTPASVMAYMQSAGSFLQQHREEIVTVGPGLYFLFVVACVLCFVVATLETGRKNQRAELNQFMANRKPQESEALDLID
jgi:hypothetical protein